MIIMATPIINYNQHNTTYNYMVIPQQSFFVVIMTDYP